MMPINWRYSGILGCSRIATGKIIPSVRTLANATIAALASRSEEKAKRCSIDNGIGKYYGDYHSLLNDTDVDAIYISLPNSMYCEWTINAANMCCVKNRLG